MNLLKERILAEGFAKSENILKVDGFLNHQVDPVLMKNIGEEFASHYKIWGSQKLLQSKVPVLHQLL